MAIFVVLGRSKEPRKDWGWMEHITIKMCTICCCWSRWSRGLRHCSAVARLLGLRVRIPPGGMGVCRECLVLSRRDLCVGLIPRPEELCCVWCVWGWTRNPSIESALAVVGLARQVKKQYYICLLQLTAWLVTSSVSAVGICSPVVPAIKRHAVRRLGGRVEQVSGSEGTARIGGAEGDIWGTGWHCKSVMQLQFVLTHRYTVLQRTGKKLSFKKSPITTNTFFLWMCLKSGH